MTDAQPYSKEQQLSRGAKRYRRKVASPKQWQRIYEEKVMCKGCRVCFKLIGTPIDPHHLIPRDYFGDDVPNNIIGLCRDCHRGVELREPAHCRLMLTRLSDAEYAYAVGKAGEGFAERIYGVEYER